MRSLLIAATSFFVAQACSGETVAENLAEITRLESAGKWEEALPIYNKAYERLRLALGGLTVRFMLRKGICELRCDLFTDAEQSFSWITKGSEAKHEEYDKVRAMFYLSETLARNNKPGLSHKGLDEANRYLEKLEDVRPGWLDWGRKQTDRINELVGDSEVQE